MNPGEGRSDKSDLTMSIIESIKSPSFKYTVFKPREGEHSFLRGMKCILGEAQEEEYNYLILLLTVTLTCVYEFQLSFWKKDAVRVNKYIEIISVQAAPELKLARGQSLFRWGLAIMVEGGWRNTQGKSPFRSRDTEILPIVGILANSMLKPIIHT